MNTGSIVRLFIIPQKRFPLQNNEKRFHFISFQEFLDLVASQQ